eukprot:COSAG06_NODE_886_length_11771_cov_13.431203_16_plen_161_part_00
MRFDASPRIVAVDDGHPTGTGTTGGRNGSTAQRSVPGHQQPGVLRRGSHQARKADGVSATAVATTSASTMQGRGGVRGGSGSSMRRQGSSRRVKGVSKRSADVVAWAAKRQEQQQVGVVLRTQRALQMDERRQENGPVLRNFIRRMIILPRQARDKHRKS